MSPKPPSKVEGELTATPLDSDNHYTMLQLPYELRLEVLRFLLVSSSPLFFQHSSRRIGNQNLKPNLPFLQNRNLARQFTTLCLVSKQIRLEAQEVFFEQNQWILDISVGYSHSFGQAATRINSAEAMSRNWGEASLRRLRYLRLNLSACHDSCRQEMRRQLESLIEQLKDANLKRLEVYWSDYKRPRGGLGSPLAMWRLRCHKDSERRGDGTRQRPAEQFLRQWAVNEVDLEPLKALRHVSEVKITGSVTVSLLNCWMLLS